MIPQGYAWHSSVCKDRFGDLSSPKAMKDPLKSWDGGHLNFTLAKVVSNGVRVHVS